MQTTTLIRRALVTAGTVTLLLAASCSSDSSTGDASPNTTAADAATEAPAGVNEADVTFVQGMIPHHEQAVQMSELVIENGADPQVIALAQQIKDAQGPEITTMQRWMSDWKVQTDSSEPTSGGMGNMDGTGMTGSSDQSDTAMGNGMMSDTEMGVMTSTTGADLDAMFLEMMIRHHQGAITMAQLELDDGSSNDAQELAQNILDAQHAEITQMQSMLGEDR